MRKSLIVTAISGLLLTSVSAPAYAQKGALEQRVDRLERMLENPVLLQLSRRLGEQQREIQQLQDENDRLKRELNSFKQQMGKQYAETDQRLNKLETGSETPAGKTTGAALTNPSVLNTTSTTNTSNSNSAAIPALAGTTAVTVNKNANASAALEESNKAENAQVNSSKANSSESSAAANTATNNTATNNTAKATANASDEKPKVEAIKTHKATEQEKQAYRAAFSLMGSGKYNESIEAFERFLQDYPSSALASNAAYWAGEGYLLKGKNQQALDAFMIVLNRYPTSSKVPDATLRAGDSYANLGNAKKAEQMYRDLIAARPGHKAAKTAQKRLEP